MADLDLAKLAEAAWHEGGRESILRALTRAHAEGAREGMLRAAKMLPVAQCYGPDMARDIRKAADSPASSGQEAPAADWNHEQWRDPDIRAHAFEQAMDEACEALRVGIDWARGDDYSAEVELERLSDGTFRVLTVKLSSATRPVLVQPAEHPAVCGSRSRWGHVCDQNAGHEGDHSLGRGSIQWDAEHPASGGEE